jgi:hypothetical protein
LGAVFQSAV